MSLVLWLHINQCVTLIDLGNIQTCIHLLIKFYSYLPIHIHWCWISAAFIFCFIIQKCKMSIFYCYFLASWFKKFSKIKVALWFIFCLISLLPIFIWTIIIRSLNYKRVISSWDILIWSTDEHMIVLKKHLVLLQNLEYSCIWNLKKTWNNWLIDLSALIQHLLNSVLWYWRAAWV